MALSFGPLFLSIPVSVPSFSILSIRLLYPFLLSTSPLHPFPSPPLNLRSFPFHQSTIATLRFLQRIIQIRSMDLVCRNSLDKSESSLSDLGEGSWVSRFLPGLHSIILYYMFPLLEASRVVEPVCCLITLQMVLLTVLLYLALY